MYLLFVIKSVPCRSTMTVRWHRSVMSVMLVMFGWFRWFSMFGWFGRMLLVVFFIIPMIFFLIILRWLRRLMLAPIIPSWLMSVIALPVRMIAMRKRYRLCTARCDGIKAHLRIKVRECIRTCLLWHPYRTQHTNCSDQQKISDFHMYSLLPSALPSRRLFF